MIRCPRCPFTCKSHLGLGIHLRKCGPLSFEESFWIKVAKGDGCWLWQARKDKLGYGRYGKTGQYVYAHRAAWLFTHGAITAGLDVCHTCDVRACCNPSHMFLGTHVENMADCHAKGRHAHGIRNSSAKLNDEKVLEILRRFERYGDRGSNAYALATEYGVNAGAIYAIASGRTWKHLSRAGDEGSIR
jgi:hypothetical protein